MAAHYQVTTSINAPRALLAVRACLSSDELSSQIPALLQRVYQGVAREVLDGQNVVVYRRNGAKFDVEIGVGLNATLTPPAGLVLVETPGGEAAHTAHWGPYAGLSRAHEAVIAWCMANERELAGPSWEIYGHWTEDPAKLLTDVYYLLASP